MRTVLDARTSTGYGSRGRREFHGEPEPTRPRKRRPSPPGRRLPQPASRQRRTHTPAEHGATLISDGTTERGRVLRRRRAGQPGAGPQAHGQGGGGEGG